MSAFLWLSCKITLYLKKQQQKPQPNDNIIKSFRRLNKQSTEYQDMSSVSVFKLTD